MLKSITTINEQARAALGITRDEYALCSYIQYRQADPRSKSSGWCSDSKEDIAEFVGITRQGLHKMVTKMAQIGLLERSKTGAIRVTGRWVDTESNSKLCLQDSVNKVHTARKLSLRETSTKFTQNVNFVDTHNKVEYDKYDKGDSAQAHTCDAPLPTPAQIVVSSPVEDTTLESKSSGPAAPAALSLSDRPNALTPGDLQTAMREFFKQNPSYWSDGIMASTPAKGFTPEKIIEVVQGWACNMIENNQGSSTYAQLNAKLTRWFMNQPRADEWAKPRFDTTSTTYTPPVRGQRFATICD